ncbi:uncharacterized protein LOC106094055 [Stomoxys calcitrans]|uniref:uncharacterized protein LOC106094055 n=1 Tax=Stomoxys calcitrans TaxID=35570 RepID=UPI0027E23A56|nr:uncharacterized protein LOC106094055 [Stomoxys calcitrans]
MRVYVYNLMLMSISVKYFYKMVNERSGTIEQLRQWNSFNPCGLQVLFSGRIVAADIGLDRCQYYHLEFLQERECARKVYPRLTVKKLDENLLQFRCLVSS